LPAMRPRTCTAAAGAGGGVSEGVAAGVVEHEAGPGARGAVADGVGGGGSDPDAAPCVGLRVTWSISFRPRPRPARALPR